MHTQESIQKNIGMNAHVALFTSCIIAHNQQVLKVNDCTLSKLFTIDANYGTIQEILGCDWRKPRYAQYLTPTKIMSNGEFCTLLISETDVIDYYTQKGDQNMVSIIKEPLNNT